MLFARLVRRWKYRKCSLGLFFQRTSLGSLLLQAIDDVGRGLRDKSRIVQLLLRRLQAFVEFGQIFVQALALSGNIDLALINHRHIEVGRRSSVSLPVSASDAISTRTHACQSRKHVGIQLRELTLLAQLTE